MTIRDPNEPAPPAPVTLGAALFVHIAPTTPRCCPCKSCGAWALVLESGAEKPFALCYHCGTCGPSPASSRWRFGRPADLNAQAAALDVQLSLL